jgi:3',5'-cyclic AMP phosphodiesterase CpdA
MPSVNILHASDLHISVHKQLRSPLDRLGDLGNPWDVSASGIAEKLRITRNLVTAWWKRMAVSSYDPEILESLAEFIYENARRKLDERGVEFEEQGGDKLDAVVLTGDLATTGREDDIVRVRKFLKAGYNPLLPQKADEGVYRGATLSAVTIPIMYMPGNHDRYVPSRARYKGIFPAFFMPDGRSFDDKLTDYRKHPVRKIEVTAPSPDSSKLRVVVLAADFSLEHFDDHEGFYGWLAQGKAYSNIRRKLVALTEQLKEQKERGETLCIIWAIHFPPEFPGGPDHGKLLGEKKFISKANKAGVSAVLAGHTHKQLTYRNPGMSFEVFCCGTTTQHEPRASVGGRDEEDAKSGNLFQIITVTSNAEGLVDVSARDFRYTGSDGRDGPLIWRWKEVQKGSN